MNWRAAEAWFDLLRDRYQPLADSSPGRTVGASTQQAPVEGPRRRLMTTLTASVSYDLPAHWAEQSLRSPRTNARSSGSGCADLRLAKHERR
jgi:hypothetical protein